METKGDTNKNGINIGELDNSGKIEIIKNEKIKKTKNVKSSKESGKKIGDSVPIVPFYSQERWQNWISKIKNSSFKPDVQENSENGNVFVYMEDDVVLACLKIIAKFDKRYLSKESALSFLSEIKDIVLLKIDPIEENIDMMLESTQMSLIGVFTSCECYINKDYKKVKSITKLLIAAIKAEQEGNMEIVLDNVAKIGANVLSGLKIKGDDFDNVPEGILAEWLDGIDCISAAMIGDTSYKDDEPDDDNT